MGISENTRRQAAGLHLDDLLRANWTEHYSSFDGQNVVNAADKTPLRMLQDAVRSRWPVAPRPHVVERLRAEKPTTNGDTYLQALPTLYPAYVEAALVAARGWPREETAQREFRLAFNAVMMAREIGTANEAAGTLRHTRASGSGWTIGTAEQARFLDRAEPLADGLLLLSAFAVPPAQPRLWMRRYLFGSRRLAGYVEKDEAVGVPVAAYLAAFEDTLLVPAALVEGGPTDGFLALHRHLDDRRTEFQAALDRLGGSGAVWWDTSHEGPGTRPFLPVAADQPLRALKRNDAEVKLRFVAHNLVRLVQLTFQRRSLPSFEGAVKALKGDHL